MSKDNLGLSLISKRFVRKYIYRKHLYNVEIAYEMEGEGTNVTFDNKNEVRPIRLTFYTMMSDIEEIKGFINRNIRNIIYLYE